MLEWYIVLLLSVPLVIIRCLRVLKFKNGNHHQIPRHKNTPFISFQQSMSFYYRVVNIGDFWVNAGFRGRAYGDITCSNLKMDITIEFRIIKIPGVSIFSDLCRFAVELLLLTTFGSMPGPGIWPFDVIT